MRLEYQHPTPSPPLREGGSWRREKGQDVVVGNRVWRFTDDSQMKTQVEKQVEELRMDTVLCPGPGETAGGTRRQGQRAGEAACGAADPGSSAYGCWPNMV